VCGLQRVVPWLVFLLVIPVGTTTAQAPEGIGGTWASTDPPSTLSFDTASGTYRWTSAEKGVVTGAFSYTQEDGLEMETPQGWQSFQSELSGDSLVLQKPGGATYRFRRSSVKRPAPTPRPQPSPSPAAKPFSSVAGLWGSPIGLVAGFAPSGRYLWFVAGRTLTGRFIPQDHRLILESGEKRIDYRFSLDGDRLRLTDPGGTAVELSRVSLRWGRCPAELRGLAYVGRMGERLRFGENGVLEVSQPEGGTVRGRYTVARGQLQVTGIHGFPPMAVCTAAGSLFLKRGNTLFIFLPAGMAGQVSTQATIRSSQPSGGSLVGKWKAQDGSYWAFFRDGTIYFGPEDHTMSGRYTVAGDHLTIILDRSGQVLRFHAAVSGITARLSGNGTTFQLRRNDLRGRRATESWFFNPDSNPEAYGFTWENTWAVGDASSW